MPTPLGYSVVLNGTEQLPTTGPIHRSNLAPPDPSTAADYDRPDHPFIGLTKPLRESLYHNFREAAQEYGSMPCLGAQPIVNGNAQPFEWLTYAQVQEKIDHLGAGLMHHGLLPLPVDKTHTSQRMLGIYMKNSIDWVLAEHAAYSFSAILVALYDTLGQDSTQFILNQTELQTVVCTAVELKKLVAIRSLCPHLKNVIISGDPVDAALEQDAEMRGLVLHHIKDLIQTGASHVHQITQIPPTRHQLATIMYTSGTTGDPKGAMLTHHALLSCAAANYGLVMKAPFPNPRSIATTHLSYLPLAHIFERVTQTVVVFFGGKIGFSQGNPLKLVDDLKQLRPTLLCAVPRVLNRIHDSIMNKVAMAPKLRKFLFHKAMKTKLERLHKSQITKHALWDKLVFRKLAASLGLDQCQMILSGSAPLSPDVLAFVRIAFPAMVLEGYGQTETSATISLTAWSDLSGGYVGAPVSSIEVRLESVPDMGYLVTDTEHGDERIQCHGRGEICVRGPNVFSGYFRLPDKTAEAIDADGWLHTGDIGLWSPLGQLKIIDRKKNIFKLSQGEYVAPEKIEIILAAGCSLIAQIFVTGDSFHSQLVAIVVPDEAVVRRVLSVHETTAFAEVCRSERLEKMVLEEMDAVGIKAKLSGFERVKHIYLHQELFSVENELLTPTFKLRRADAQKYFTKQIDALYERSGDMIAGKNLRQ